MPGVEENVRCCRVLKLNPPWDLQEKKGTRTEQLSKSGQAEEAFARVGYGPGEIGFVHFF